MPQKISRLLAETGPMILRANTRQFSSGELFSFSCVESRMLLWCKSGKGLVTVNQQRVMMATGRFLLTPWKHAVDYHADPDDPFMLGGIHIIPRMSPQQKYVMDVSHDPKGDLSGDKDRGDFPWKGLEGLKQADFSPVDGLWQLSSFVVNLFHRRDPAEGDCRMLARLLIDELQSFFARPEKNMQALPRELSLSIQYINDHLKEKLTLEEIARINHSSVATIVRMFRNHLKTSFVEYVTDRRIQSARHLLASTNMRVHEVGTEVGVPDPFYFSRLFKKRVGMTPLDFQRKSSLI